MNRLALPAGLAAARDQWRMRWNRLARRERRLVTTALTVIGAVLLWMLAVQPALRTLRDTPVQLDAVELQLQQMQRQAAESRELRKLPTVKPAQAEAALRGATERLGANARITLQGDRATLTLSGVPGEALAAWLGEVRSAARARPDEVKLSRGPNGYSGSVLLSLSRPG